MSETDTVRNSVHEFPNDPGVYLMKDRDGTIIYIGKAKNLKKRVTSYFSTNKEIKTRMLMNRVVKIEYIVTRNEYEALLLENTLIKKWKPRYNINLKDGKTYPVIRITAEEYPRVFRTRRIIRDGSEYYGPFTEVQSLDRYLELIERLFPLRKCRGPLKKREHPCLYFHIGRCSGICAGRISREEYLERVAGIRKLLSGDTEGLITDLTARMEEEVQALRFERAAYYRDAIRAIGSLSVEQQVIDFDPESRDYGACASRREFFVFTVFQMRGGKLLGRDIFRSQGLDTTEESMEQFLVQYYGSMRNPPARLFLSFALPDDGLAAYLRRELSADVAIEIPETGRDRSALRMAEANAREELEKWLRERGNVDALKDLQELLGLPTLPKRIEGFDIAQLSGTFPVASMVSFRNGNPDKSSYRRFHMKSLGGAIDDYEAMREVVARRYTRVLNENLDRPDLILIDGGKGQVNAALSILRTLGLDSIPVVGLAKKFEEIHVPGRTDPIRLPEGTAALRLLQYVRDESHRFATGFNQRLRGKQLAFSVLEGVPGIGEKRSRKLMEACGSVEALVSRSPEDIAAIAGISRKKAEELLGLLHERLAAAESVTGAGEDAAEPEAEFGPAGPSSSAP